MLERRGERAVFLAVGAGKLCDLGQMVERLIAVALFDLPQAVILPGLDMIGVRLQGALIPDLRKPVVAKLAVGVADQGGDGRIVVVTERLELIDRRCIVVGIVDDGISGAISFRKFRIVPAFLAWDELGTPLLFALP